MKFIKIKTYVALGTILTCMHSNAGLIVNPVRCAVDSLPQWLHDTDPTHYDSKTDSTGTARGRNAWWKTCNPSAYKMAYPDSKITGIDAEFNVIIQGNQNTRLYPTFGIVTGSDPATREVIFTNKINEIPWVAPTTEPNSIGSEACNLPTDFEFVGLCTSGCVTPEQEIKTPSAEKPIVELERLKNFNEISVLVPEANDRSFKMELNEFGVKSFVKDLIPTEQKILEINTRSGKTVRVSLNHPLLTEDFTMKQAQDLTLNNSLITSAGEADPITSINQVKYFGKLHNMYVDTPRLEQSLYIVQGLISGDKKYQDVSISDINRAILRKLVSLN